MRTEYKLYHWPADDTVAAAVTGPFRTQQEAAAATDTPSFADWETQPDGGWTPPCCAGWSIYSEPVPETDAERIQAALDVALEYGGIDGGCHKMWVLDQVVRYLAGDRYTAFVESARADGHGWSEGIAP